MCHTWPGRLGILRNSIGKKTQCDHLYLKLHCWPEGQFTASDHSNNCFWGRFLPSSDLEPLLSFSLLHQHVVQLHKGRNDQVTNRMAQRTESTPLIEKKDVAKANKARAEVEGKI